MMDVLTWQLAALRSEKGVKRMTTMAPGNYDPHAFKALTFYDATPRFHDGADTPRAYLERCLETIAGFCQLVAHPA
jgi:hypothetical protein